MSKKSVSLQGSFIFDTPVMVEEKKHLLANDSSIPWIKVVRGIPYFITDDGDSWIPIGQNDAITWPELTGAFRRKNMDAVEAYMSMLSAQGVTCLRLMLEYCQSENRYLEKPAGVFQNNMVQLWDDIFLCCKKYSLRILLTPYDTFWMWRRWSHHPYNHINNGPCIKRSQWLLCAGMREAIKERLYFATRRWGGSGVLFAWDLWNEIRPAHSGNSSNPFTEFINDIGSFLHKAEMELHGRAHLQTVSVFTPLLQKNQRIVKSVINHDALDFATVHLYGLNNIDNPKNTVDAAIATGMLTRQVINHLKDKRPFFDSEHGPIKTFNSHGKTLAEDFDNEYFRHIQWAHVASGGAGGGMRWPYRHPHALTEGMRNAQLALAGFLPLISWNQFDRVNLNEEIKLGDPGLTVFACGDKEQTLIWLLRTNAKGKNKMLRKDARAEAFEICIPLLQPGKYNVTLWDTLSGSVIDKYQCMNECIMKLQLPPVITDLAVYINLDGNPRGRIFNN